MAVLTALALAAGIASAGYGAYESAQGKSQQAEGLAQQQRGYAIEQQAAKQQADISKEQAAASVGFAGQERSINIGASDQSKAAAIASQSINRDIFAQQSNIQTYQRQAMETDARRSNLEQIRNEQRSRSISLATGVAQGGSGYVSGSSARGGAYGGISGQAQTNLLSNQQALGTGENVFAANANISQSNIQMNDLQLCSEQRWLPDTSGRHTDSHGTRSRSSRYRWWCNTSWCTHSSNGTIFYICSPKYLQRRRKYQSTHGWTS